MTTHFRANGKLLLTGEYFVLDGTPGLAVPTRPGQTLTVEPRPGNDRRFSWLALDERGEQWFSAVFDRETWLGARPQVRSEDTKARISQLLFAAEEISPGCTECLVGKNLTTELEFNRKWGLGSSSTLVANLARLLEVNPYALLEKTFGGSGYDLACALAEGPILYERNGAEPRVTTLDWRPEWINNTVFVYRNQKQNSRAGIRRYREQTVPDAARREIAELSLVLINETSHLRAAARILRRHEAIVSEVIGLPTVQEELFADFPGQLKSLGAWGGDFIWALSAESPEKTTAYFNDRGYPTVIPYNQMVR